MLKAKSLHCSESLLQVINDVLRQLAKRKVDALRAEVDEALSKLQFSPSTTVELADSLAFQDEIQGRVRCTFFMLIAVSLAVRSVCDKTCRSKVIFTVCSHDLGLLSSPLSPPFNSSPLYLVLSDCVLLHSILSPR